MTDLQETDGDDDGKVQGARGPHGALPRRSAGAVAAVLEGAGPRGIEGTGAVGDGIEAAAVEGVLDELDGVGVAGGEEGVPLGVEAEVEVRGRDDGLEQQRGEHGGEHGLDGLQDDGSQAGQRVGRRAGVRGAQEVGVDVGVEEGGDGEDDDEPCRQGREGEAEV